MWSHLLHTSLKYYWNVHTYCQTLWQRHASIFLDLSFVLWNGNCIFSFKKHFYSSLPSLLFHPKLQVWSTMMKHFVKFRVACVLCHLYSNVPRRNSTQTITKLQDDQPLNFLLHGVHAKSHDRVLLQGQLDWPTLLVLFPWALPHILHPHVTFIFYLICKMLVSESILVLSV